MLGFILSSSAFAATLHVSAGILTGASGVEVAGQLYDVEFREGTCVELFSGCDGLSDFTFRDEASATLAGSALFDQVFLDTGLGNFDSVPHLTSGCEILSPPACAAGIPFGFSADMAQLLLISADNTSGGPSDSVYLGYATPEFDNGAGPARARATWAVFSGPPVPEPGTALLVGLGLAGLAASGREPTAPAPPGG